MTISKKTKIRILAIKLITFLTEQGYGWEINKIALDQVRGIKEDEDEFRNSNTLVKEKDKEGQS